jgi:N-acyl-D-amino-acid deacylase
MRNEDDRLMEAVDEAIAVATGAGCPLQISHLKTQGPRNWPKIDTVLARIEAVKAAGLDIAFDRYPYIAYQTGLSNLFPASSRDGGTGAFLARLADPTTGPELRALASAKAESIGGWDNVMIASVRAEEDKPAEGQRLGTYAKSVGVPPDELTVAMLVRNDGSVGMVGFAMSEDNLARFLAHPLGMVCSDGGAFAIDGPARRGHPHPRGLGSFPRVLGHFVRDARALTLEQAVWKMSGFPASRVGLADRGRLRVGAAGDVVVFDAATVADRATFTEPFQYPVGIPHVLINGTFAVREGEQTPGRAGRALRIGRR